MYLPARFAFEDQAAILDLIRANPLATVISVHDGDTFISHLPLIIEDTADGLMLIGHLATANPHSKLLDDSDVKIVFHGPDAYITPQWYEKNDVPTWNYAVVHMKGHAQIISDSAGIVDCLRKLTAHAEKAFETPWEFWIPDDLAGGVRLESAICGFKIVVQDMKAKFKLSQNRSNRDRENVIEKLTAQGTECGLRIAQLMDSLAKNE